MTNDPAIQSVRETRHAISESFDHDPQRLVAYYRELQLKCADRIVLRTGAGTQKPKDENVV